MEENEVKNKDKYKVSKREVGVKIMALVLALLMLFSVGLTLIYYAIYYFKK